MNCVSCGKHNEFTSYCNWDCHVAAAKAAGGLIRQPNGLPIKSIKADGSMWEHEHGDHPDYKFPVEIDFVGSVTPDDVADYEMICGEKAPDEDAIRRSKGETHALIYSDYSVAITMYECCYAMWSLRNGNVMGRSLWDKGVWRLSPTSVEKIIFMKRTA